MTKKETYVGPSATACKPGAGTDAQNGTFDRILVAAAEHAAREAGLPGRADRVIACRSCGCETTADRICPACAEALRVERAAALDELCRVHRVRYVEDLPPQVLKAHRDEWGWC